METAVKPTETATASGGLASDCSKSGLPTPARDFGDCELLELLGEGGQGAVYRARQKSLNRIVALKLLRGGVRAAYADAVRFRAEAAAAAALRHPGIVGVHEIGERDGQPFYAMEFVEGADLGRLVQEEMVSPEWAARCVARAAEAVQAAHEHGVLHRDLKPSNVLLDADDAPRILDFGLARRLDDAAHLTLSHQALGTPGYAAPELATGRHRGASAATDVYGLGAVLYFLLTSRPPFVGDSVPDVLRQVVEQEPVAPRTLRPAIPRDLETICMKCLRKEPARRYPTARALTDDLERFLRHEPIEARPVSTIERAWRWCRRKPRVAALVLSLTGALLALAVGSTAAAIRINAARIEEQRQHERAERALGDAYLAQARAQRGSGRPGQRFGTIEAVTKAIELGSLTPERKVELRKEAIASFALVDLRPIWTKQFKLGVEFTTFDRNLERYAVVGTNGTISVRRVVTEQELVSFVQPVDGTAWRPWEFSPDGRLLAVTSWKTNLSRIWNLDNGRLVIELTGTPPTFSPDGRRIFVYDTSIHSAVWRDLMETNRIGRVAPGLRYNRVAVDRDGASWPPASKARQMNRPGALFWTRRPARS
jgi:predicted Ser/Thr protein kinase